MDKFTYRHAVPADAVQLADLAAELNAYHKDDFRPDPDKIKADWDCFEAFVAADAKGKILAFVAGYEAYQFQSATRHFEIQNLHVAHSHRRKGIGRELMRFVIAEKFRQGLSCFKLGYQGDNSTAQAFYASLGFEEKPKADARRAWLEGDPLQELLNKGAHYEDPEA